MFFSVSIEQKAQSIMIENKRKQSKKRLSQGFITVSLVNGLVNTCILFLCSVGTNVNRNEEIDEKEIHKDLMN